MREDKRLAAMRANPLSVRFDDLAAVLESVGFTQRRGKGSHVLFKHPQNNARLSVPDSGHGYVKPTYVRKALELADAARQAEEDDGRF